jgi:uncharacterized membrane protein/predicted DsbA family dithiol-disulfide isomerase
MKRIHSVVLAVLSLVALGVSVYLTYVHYRLHEQPGWHSACAISAAINCETVLTSPYGSIAGTPVSALGAWFYGLTTLIAVGAFFRANLFSRSPALALFFAGSFASALSLVLIALSATIGSLCPLCAVLYFINFAILVFSWRAVRFTGEGIAQALAAERKWCDKHLTQATLSTAAAISVLVAIFLVFSQDPVTPSRFCQALAALATKDTNSGPAPVVVYLDFQCPHCRELDHVLRAIRGNSRVRIVPRRHPQERECNPGVTQGGRQGACLQARAAICAETLGRYDEFSDKLFDDGPRDEAGLLALAVSLELDPSSFRSCLDSADTLRQLQAEMAAAKADGIYALPTLVVSGLRHVGALTKGDRACLWAVAGDLAGSRSSLPESRDH